MKKIILKNKKSNIATADNTAAVKNNMDKHNKINSRSLDPAHDLDEIMNRESVLRAMRRMDYESGIYYNFQMR